jgi:hypothetical protein
MTKRIVRKLKKFVVEIYKSATNRGTVEVQAFTKREAEIKGKKRLEHLSWNQFNEPKH